MSEKTIKIRVGQEFIVGLLNEKASSTFLSDRKTRVNSGKSKKKLIIIAHGQGGHKSYLFQPLLQQTLPHSIFAFDFRGNGHSSGSCSINFQYKNWVADIEAVIDHFREEYEIYGIIGHSAGATSAIMYCLMSNMVKPRFVVSISGRYDVYEGRKKKHKDYWNEFEEKGCFTVPNYFKDQPLIITKADVEEWKEMDKIIQNYPFPTNTAILCIHGLEDPVIPVTDCVGFASLTSKSSIQLINANHNFSCSRDTPDHLNPRYILVDKIIDWFMQQETSFAAFWKIYGNFIRPNPEIDMNIFDKPVKYYGSRVINVSGVINFRDIGGLTNVDGKTVKLGVCFRSANISRITEDGISMLKSLVIKEVYSLMSNSEVGDLGVLQHSGISCHHFPIFSDEQYTPERKLSRLKNYLHAGTAGFIENYMDILNDGCLSIGKIFHRIADNPTNFLLHCSIGKDRTGIVVALLLSILSVSVELIAFEYSISQYFMCYDIEVLKPILEKASIYEEILNDKSKLERLNSSSGDVMKIFLSKIYETYGSPREYLIDKCGVTSEEVDVIRKRMLEE